MPAWFPSKRRSMPDLRPRDPKSPLEGELGKRRVVDCSVSQVYQSDYHEVAPVDTKLFGSEDVDIGFLCSYVSKASLGGLFKVPKPAGTAKPAGGTSAAGGGGGGGGVHVSEELWMHRPIRLGETVTICPEEGAKAYAHRMGTFEETRYKFRDLAGEVPLEISRSGISVGKTPENLPPAPKAAKGPEDAREGKALVGKIEFKPQMVVDFCNDWDERNPMHHNPEKARAAGYRDPIWGGTQGMHICMEHVNRLAKGRKIQKLHMIVFFKKAVVWDESVELWYAQAAGKADGVGEYVLLRPGDGGKGAMEMEVMDVEYAGAAAKL